MMKRTTCSILTLALLSGCSNIKHDEYQAKVLLSQGKVIQAKSHYSYLAEFGLPSAQKKLAKLLYKNGNEQDAYFWLSKPSLQTDLGAQLYLARLRMYSDDPKIKNVPQGQQDIFNLVEQGFEGAVVDLIKMSKGGQQLSPKYLNHIALKADQQSPSSCLLMGELFIAGELNNVSASQAKSYLYCALKKHDKAYTLLATLFNQHPDAGSFDEFFDLIKSKAPQAVSKSVFNIANKIASGKLSHWQVNHSEQLYQWLGNQFPQAYYQLAKLYIKNPTLGKSIDDVLMTLQQGKALNVADCYVYEAEIYLYGKGVIQDPWQAKKILENLAETSAYADYIHGMLYSVGFMGEPNYPIGLALIERSALNGFKRADYALAKLYREGLGLKPDPIKSFSHYILANDNSDNIMEYQQKFNISDITLAKAKQQAQLTQQRRTQHILQDELHNGS